MVNGIIVFIAGSAHYLTIYVAFIGMKLGVVQSGVINIINFMWIIYYS